MVHVVHSCFADVNVLMRWFPVVMAYNYRNVEDFTTQVPLSDARIVSLVGDVSKRGSVHEHVLLLGVSDPYGVMQRLWAAMSPSLQKRMELFLAPPAPPRTTPQCLRQVTEYNPTCVRHCLSQQVCHPSDKALFFGCDGALPKREAVWRL